MWIFNVKSTLRVQAKRWVYFGLYIFLGSLKEIVPRGRLLAFDTKPNDPSLSRIYAPMACMLLYAKNRVKSHLMLCVIDPSLDNNSYQHLIFMLQTLRKADLTKLCINKRDI